MKRTLDGMVVVITGASSGIGRAAAIELASSGANVHRALGVRDGSSASGFTVYDRVILTDTVVAPPGTIPHLHLQRHYIRPDRHPRRPSRAHHQRRS